MIPAGNLSGRNDDHGRIARGSTSPRRAGRGRLGVSRAGEGRGCELPRPLTPALSPQAGRGSSPSPSCLGIAPPPDRMKANDMFDIQREELIWGGRKLTLETGKIARQADGAVLATYGETTVLATVVSREAAEARLRLLPAHRQLPGKDLRRRQDPGRLLQARRPPDREGDADLAPHRPPDPPAVRRRATRTRPRSSSPCSRTTSRTIPTSSRMVAASAALTLSGVPFMGPIGGARVGYINGELRAQPAARRDGRTRRSTSSSPAPPTPC